MWDLDFKGSIEGFTHSLAFDRGADERTVKAYRLDLELFFRWLGLNGWSGQDSGPKGTDGQDGYGWEEKIEAYLRHLSGEKGLRFTTICRKHRVFGYYLSYLETQGYIEKSRPLRLPDQPEERRTEMILTKKEIDTFFRAIDQEYRGLDSDFRRRVCLRDHVMMELLFYHRIEISELLRLEVSDYDRRTAVLKVRRKRERDRTVHLFSRALQKQMLQWLEEHAYFEHGGAYRERMFLSKLGRPLSMQMVTNIFEKYRVLAGIEKECTPRDLKNGLGRYAEEVVREMG